jgi:hypothetical protein
MSLTLMDLNEDNSFGKFYGHPNGNEFSKEMVIRLLDEFNLSISYFNQLILDIPIPQNFTHLTNLQSCFQLQFRNSNWQEQPYYPESGYQADFGLKIDNRWIFAEVELSDIRRAVNAFFMDRVFRTGFMRLGIVIVPEDCKIENRNKNFYSQLTKRYNYISPNYPLWVIGFGIKSETL